MRIWLILIALAAATTSASADDKIFSSTLRLKVGETRQIGIFGAHSSDCIKSIAPGIEILQAPVLGALTQRGDVAYVARNSIRHTCEGARFLGTAIDYTAKTVGTDHIRFDAVFSNGRAHNVVTIVNH